MQLEIMRSALGGSRVNDSSKFGWRNYFSAGTIDPNLEALVQQGLMVRDGVRTVYSVTKAGARLLGVPESRIKSLGKELPDGIVPKPKPDTSSRIKSSRNRELVSGMARGKNASVLQYMFSHYQSEQSKLFEEKDLDYAKIEDHLRRQLAVARRNCRLTSSKSSPVIVFSRIRPC
jgi:DNA-binding PadR family transcriptional regulator